MGVVIYGCTRTGIFVMQTWKNEWDDNNDSISEKPGDKMNGEEH